MLSLCRLHSAGDVGSLPFSSPRKVALNWPKEKTNLGWRAGEGAGVWHGWDHSACQPGSRSSPPLNLHNHAMTMPSTVGGGPITARGLWHCPPLALSAHCWQGQAKAAHSSSPSWPPLLPVSRPCLPPVQGGCLARPLDSPRAVGTLSLRSLGLSEGHPSRHVAAAPGLQPCQGPEAAFPDHKARGQLPPSRRSIWKSRKLSQLVLANGERGGQSYSCQPLACFAERPFPCIQITPYLK